MIFGWVILALVGSGLLYGVNEVFIDDNDESGPSDEQAPDAQGVDDLLNPDPDAQDPNAEDPDAEDPAQDDPDASDSDEDMGDDTVPATDDTTIRANNVLDASATDFRYAPDDFADQVPVLSYFVDENVDFGTDTVVLPSDTGNTQFEDVFDVRFLSADSGPQAIDAPDADIYLIGSTGDDIVGVSSGHVIANLGEGNDSFSDVGLELGERVLDDSGSFVEFGTNPLDTASGGLERGIDFGANNEVQRVFAGDGNDTVDVRAAGGLVYGGDGNDEIQISNQAVYARGGAGDDVITHVEVAEDAEFTSWHWLRGEGDNDTITSGNSADFIFGDSYEARDDDGNDSIDAGGGNDSVWGGGGSDFIDAGEGDDVVYSGAATYFHNVTPTNGDGSNFDWFTDNTADTIVAGNGDDTIFADSHDTIDLANTLDSPFGDSDEVHIAHDTRTDSDRIAVVQNFDPARDELRIRLDPTQLPEDALSDTYNEDVLRARSLRSDDGDTGVVLAHMLEVVDGDTVVVVNGINVAVLEGVGADQHENLDVNVRVWLEVEETDVYRA